jgi:hypothetical protein
VFWRETGMKDDDEEVEAREGACSMETAMALLGDGDVWVVSSGSVEQSGRGEGVLAKECCSTRRVGLIGAGDKEDYGSGTRVTQPREELGPVAMGFVRFVEIRGVGGTSLCASRAVPGWLEPQQDCTRGTEDGAGVLR